MVQSTSLQAYNKIVKYGLLPESRLRIYTEIVNSPKITSSELFDKLNLKTNQSGRLTELQKLGCIKEFETRKCNQTGNTAISWISTEKLPRDIRTKAPTKKDRKIEAIDNVHSFMKSLYMNSEQVKEYYNIIKLIEKI